MEVTYVDIVNADDVGQRIDNFFVTPLKRGAAHKNLSDFT